MRTSTVPLRNSETPLTTVRTGWPSLLCSTSAFCGAAGHEGGSVAVSTTIDVHAGKSAVNTLIAQKLISQITRQSTTSTLEPLTDRELEVLTMTAKGYTNKAIGAQLGISDRTVQGHLAHIFDKLNATSGTEAVMRAVSFGWITQDVIQNIEDER